MSKPETVYDDTEWEVDPAEPEVGIFQEAFVHTVCPNEYEQGCRIESRLSVSDKPGYANEHYTVTCLDCGATTEFTDLTYVGE